MKKRLLLSLLPIALVAIGCGSSDSTDDTSKSAAGSAAATPPTPGKEHNSTSDQLAPLPPLRK